MNRYDDYTILSFGTDQAVLQHKATRQRMTATVAGHVQRLPYHLPHDGICFRICCAPIEADDDNDVRLPILVDDSGEYVPEYPRCPDCGGALAWAEAGRAPGSRICVGTRHGRSSDSLQYHGDTPGDAGGCGSTFVDTRYGPGLPPPRPAGAASSA